MGISTVLGQAVVIPPDSTESPTPDVDDFLFDTEGLDDEDADLGGYNPGVMWNSSRGGSKKTSSLRQKKSRFSAAPYCNFSIKNVSAYFTRSTIALNASGLFIARSARALRFNSMPFFAKLPMKAE